MKALTRLKAVELPRKPKFKLQMLSADVAQRAMADLSLYEGIAPVEGVIDAADDIEQASIYSNGLYSLATAQGSAFLDELAVEFIAHPEKAEDFFRSIGMLEGQGELAKRFGG